VCACCVDWGGARAELLTKKYNYEHKVSVESKTDSGVKFTCTGTHKKDGTTGEVKAAYSFTDGVDLETVVSDTGNLSTKIEAANVLAPGLKTSATGHYTDPNSSKARFLENHFSSCFSSTSNEPPCSSAPLYHQFAA
jgi:voltage-dependent anion channel protein 2